MPSLVYGVGGALAVVGEATAPSIPGHGRRHDFWAQTGGTHRLSVSVQTKDSDGDPALDRARLGQGTESTERGS